MSRWRNTIFKVLMILGLAALPGADIECEDGDFEFNWPSFHNNNGGYYYYEDWYEPAPCCWWW